MSTPEEIARFLLLSENQKLAIQLLLEGKSYKEIADTMSITGGAVSTHFSRAYIKLDVAELDRAGRLLVLVKTYYPMLSMDFETNSDIEIIPSSPNQGNGNELIVADIDLEIATFEQEEMVKSDIEALLVLRNASIAIVPKNSSRVDTKPNNKRNNEEEKSGKLGCWARIKRAIFIFLGLFFLMTICAGYGYLEYQKGNLEFLNNIPFEITEWVGGQLGFPAQSPTQLSLPTSPPTVESIVEVLPTNTPIPPQNIIAPTNTALPTNTQVPTPTITPKPLVTGPLYEVGEWHKEGDLWFTLSSYNVYYGIINISIEVWNKSGNEIFFSWNPAQNFSMVDNKYAPYEQDSDYMRNVQVGAGERMTIMGGYGGVTLRYDDDPLYAPGVTDLYLVMEFVSRVERATWHFEIGK